eukprot:7186889-Lingulodinium_polyedra.AAC.1
MPQPAGLAARRGCRVWLRWCKHRTCTPRAPRGRIGQGAISCGCSSGGLGPCWPPECPGCCCPACRG